MAQLIFQSSGKETKYLIQKQMVTIGTENAHDVVVIAEKPGVVFSLFRREDGAIELLPGGLRLKINSEWAPRRTLLLSCDRVEWNGGLMIFLESDIPAGKVEQKDAALRSLSILQNLAASLQQNSHPLPALHQALDALVDTANAESGYLISEMKENGSWELLASKHDAEANINKKDLLSNTILQESLRRREPVYIGNIVGHPWSQAESIIESRLFSAACFPLILADRVLGAVFLMTRSPGRSIRKETLPELSLVATQAALMLASRVQLQTFKNENARLKQLLPRDNQSLLIHHPSSCMSDLSEKISKVAPTPLSVLILGETGSGKEVVAKEIHRLSTRENKPFIAVNCAAIPGPLLESILFGHERGAFTGAVKNQTGKFMEANEGTLFLDEIGELPLELQVKLLRVLQEKRVEPLGSTKSTSIDVRILAATNIDLEKAVEAGRFRQDLFYRLNGLLLKVPPLRERKQDLKPLVEMFLQKLEKTNVQISENAWEKMQNYSWPGNVRELEHAITRAVFLSSTNQVEPTDLELTGKASKILEEFEAYPENLKEAQDLFTREYVQSIVTKFGGSRAEVAERLGISERTVYRILSDKFDSPL